MEETCRESLGATGDLALTEGDEDDQHPAIPKVRRTSWATEGSVGSTSDATVKSGKSRRRKRRRLEPSTSPERQAPPSND